ncbi:hypothetical protein DYB38_011187 [Aphanomyces astaci]|uniref:Uncharacterized protein n=1 Tax=Aphanomyces astaci TaxID=112090 RepID=A0A397CKP9_APHAT|nr:hypothetical protein DYB38_011187 [Aphanomyces astaci]
MGGEFPGAVPTNVVVPVQLAQLALQRRNSDALAKIDSFLDSLLAASSSKAALLLDSAINHSASSSSSTVDATSLRKKHPATTTLDGGATHVDLHHDLGIDILVNVFSEFEASGVTAYSSATLRDDEKKQMWLLRQSLAQQLTTTKIPQASPSKRDLLKDRYGISHATAINGAMTTGLTRRTVFAKQPSSNFNLGMLMEVEMEHRLKELFSVASEFHTIMNKTQVHLLSACVVDVNQDMTTPLVVEDKPQRVLNTELSLLQKDEVLTFGSFKNRFLKVSTVSTKVVPVKTTTQKTTSPQGKTEPTAFPTKHRLTKLQYHDILDEEKPWMAQAARAIVTPSQQVLDITSHPSSSSLRLVHKTHEDDVYDHDSSDALDELDQSMQSPVRREKRDSVDLTKHMGVMPRWKKRDSVDLMHAKRAKEKLRPAAIVYDNTKGQAPNIRQKLQECKVMMLSLTNLNFGSKK